jgi:hypothetical protein
MYRHAAQNGDVFGAYKFLQFQQAGVVPAPSQDASMEGVNTLVLKQGDVETPADAAKEI